MERQLLDKLLIWKNKNDGSILLVSGACGVGKSYLLSQLLGSHFSQLYQFNIVENPELLTQLNNNMQPSQFVALLELLHGTPIDPQGLIVFTGLDSLNQFVMENPSLTPAKLSNWLALLQRIASKAPQLSIAASCVDCGELATNQLNGLTHHTLRPLSFREFLHASPHRALAKTFTKQVLSPAAHQRLSEQFRDYCFTGGMPQAVATWFNLNQASICERINAVSAIHQQHLSQLQQAMLGSNLPVAPLRALLEQIAKQLASATYTSVQRFKFKGVFQQKNRYQDFAQAIKWLENQHWLLANYPLSGSLTPPLSQQQKPSMVKLFLYDIGLLHYLLGLDYKSLKLGTESYPSYLMQSFVQQELAALGHYPSYSWHDARAEMEFIIPHSSGAVLPIEVKSPLRTRAKSLPSYQKKCQPQQTVKLHAGFPPADCTTTHHWPLYFCEFALNLLPLPNQP
ncbi:DUF4143 domain-containing protein [Motilimonas sp. KMU-193]|uniref:DUF4143 domain-containing protein n=1 Tax=Motilimonas sp. KMU-193 TaxID=3388668 RepID=UPI00396B1126